MQNQYVVDTQLKTALFNRSKLRNRPRSIYQYSNTAFRLSGQTSIFGVVFSVSKSLLGIERQNKPKKSYYFDPKALESCYNIDILNMTYWQ